MQIESSLNKEPRLGNWGHLHGENMLVLQTVMWWGKMGGGKFRTTHKSLYSAAAFKNSKITSGLTVLKRSLKREPGKISAARHRETTVVFILLIYCGV